MGLFPLLVYIALSALVGLRGMYTRLGFWGSFLLSLLLTPVIMFLGLILFEPGRARHNGSPPSQ